MSAHGTYQHFIEFTSPNRRMSFNLRSSNAGVDNLFVVRFRVHPQHQQRLHFLLPKRECNVADWDEWWVECKDSSASSKRRKVGYNFYQRLLRQTRDAEKHLIFGDITAFGLHQEQKCARRRHWDSIGRSGLGSANLCMSILAIEKGGEGFLAVLY